MPGFVLHLNAVVTCAHAGQAIPTSVVPNVLVMGQSVVTFAAQYAIAGCVFPPPPVANGPCVTAQFVTSATRVFAQGVPVLLQDSQAICAPTGTPILIMTTQTRVFGV
jgi:hypothetical protein